MAKLIELSLIIGAVLLIASCAASMSPAKVNETLPTFTKSNFLLQTQAEEAIKSNRCKYLVRGRYYNAPIGMTAKGDLRNGAKGIDEWVELDGGNAYTLISYEWVTLDKSGVTQLNVKFDTMECD